MALNVSARLTEPFHFPGNSTGLLLIHGFTGSPSELRFLGERLAAQGFTVKGILLAGHGTVPEELAKKRWEDWLNDAENGVTELRTICTKVLAIGLSMGGLLALELAARGLVDGVAALNAPMVLMDWRARLVGLAKPFVRFVEKSVPQQKASAADQAARRDSAYQGERANSSEQKAGASSETQSVGVNSANHDKGMSLGMSSANRGEDLERFQYTRIPLAALDSLNKAIPRVRKRLGQITCPALVMQSTKDQTVAPKSAQILMEGLKNTNAELVYWRKSGHILTLGPEREAVALEITRFVRQVEGLS